MRRTIAISTAAILTFTIAACTSSTTSPETGNATTSETTTETSLSPSETPTTDAPSSATAPSTPRPDETWTSGESQSDDFPELTGNYLPTGARAAVDNGIERAIIQYAAGTGDLEWHAQWVDEAIADGSGLPVEIQGSAILQITVSGVRYPDEGEDMNLEPAFPTTQVIRDINVQAPFEGMHLIFIGLDAQSPYFIDFDDDTYQLSIEFPAS